MSPSAQKTYSVAEEQGVDIVLGGHDHYYFVSNGVTTWEGYDVSEPGTGAEWDDGDILVVKSGPDFRDLSELTLELVDTSAGSVRKKVIKAAHGECSLLIRNRRMRLHICSGKRHEIQPGMSSSKTTQKILDDLLPSISDAW